MNILKYVGVYVLIGFVLHMGWTLIFEVWIHKKVGEANFSEAIAYYLGLKMRLYDKSTTLHAAKAVMEAMLSKGAAAFVLWIALTMLIWPMAFFEDIAVYNDMVDYVNDVAQGKGSSES